MPRQDPKSSGWSSWLSSSLFPTTSILLALCFPTALLQEWQSGPMPGWVSALSPTPHSGGSHPLLPPIACQSTSRLTRSLSDAPGDGPGLCGTPSSGKWHFHSTYPHNYYPDRRFGVHSDILRALPHSQRCARGSPQLHQGLSMYFWVLSHGISSLLLPAPQPWGSRAASSRMCLLQSPSAHCPCVLAHM